MRNRKMVKKEDGEYKRIISIIEQAEKDEKILQFLKKTDISNENAKKIAIFMYGRMSR
ncbi:hypothetical protein [Listeria floridensis]|uniref:hypothetical protein n=1 Tax=Listeria floridensis TaxID=1494962 RepID=UPI0004BCEB0E|nr:hypothetical protein [Listeria floridensis]